MDKSTIDQLNPGEIIRIDYHNSAWDENRCLPLAVDTIDKKKHKTVIKLVGKWGESAAPKLVADTNGVKLTEDTSQEGPVSSIQVIGQIDPDTGRYYVLFRRPQYRDHILQKSGEGRYRTLCRYKVNVSDGKKVRADEVTPRQRSLMNLCDQCSSQLHNTLTLDLPTYEDWEKTEQESQFYCPDCGESVERVEYESMLNGMFSHHADGNSCGPWHERHYLEWRVDGVNTDRDPDTQ